MEKSVLITGAAARVGRVLALGLAADGWATAIHYNHSENQAKDVVSEIKAHGGNAIAIGANLSVPQDRDDLMTKASDVFDSKLTALINNASTFSPDQADTFTAASLIHHMSVNLEAPLHLSQHFVKHIGKKRKGIIINMLDQRVINPSPDYFTYSISKAALYAATKTMAQGFAPNIRVCGIGPGPVLRNVHQTAAAFERDKHETLLKTGSPPETILHAVRYLLAAEAVTGQMIAVDAGEHLKY